MKIARTKNSKTKLRPVLQQNESYPLSALLSATKIGPKFKSYIFVSELKVFKISNIYTKFQSVLYSFQMHSLKMGFQSEWNSKKPSFAETDFRLNDLPNIKISYNQFFVISIFRNDKVGRSFCICFFFFVFFIGEKNSVLRFIRYFYFRNDDI